MHQTTVSLKIVFFLFYIILYLMQSLSRVAWQRRSSISLIAALEGKIDISFSPHKDDDLPVKPRKEWIHMDNVEFEKLEWMKDLPSPRQKKTKKVWKQKLILCMSVSGSGFSAVTVLKASKMSPLATQSVGLHQIERFPIFFQRMGWYRISSVCSTQET